jgi:hypothetical protein
MEALIIEGSPKTPTVNFNPNGTIELKGRSIPENSIEFYKPIIAWLDEYNSNAQPNTAVNIQLEYFNTSSSKCILDVFKKLEAIHNGGNSSIVINWHYEEDDEDMLEAGEDYQAIINVPFKMIELEED